MPDDLASMSETNTSAIPCSPGTGTGGAESGFKGPEPYAVLTPSSVPSAGKN
jgi:hypothetical protein